MEGTRVKKRLGLVLAGTLALMVTEAVAQSWPSRQIEMIIPFPAGGGVDAIARATGAAMAADLGANIVPVNRDGAAGTIGFSALAFANADGYTIGGGPTTPIANAPFLQKGVKYNVDSFEYICQTWENVMAVAVTQESKYKTIQDLLAAAKAAPGRVTYGHAGIGTIPHLAAENLAEALSLKFQQIPFRGDAPMLPVLLKGDLDFASTALSSIRGMTNLRVLAVFAGKRSADHPNAPTDKELGVKTSVPPGHNGIFTPKGIPDAVRTKLETACANAVKKEAVVRAIANVGAPVTYLTGAQFRAQTVADYQFKGDLIRRIGLEAK
jgi:tripartite-type tricarboxylate transporter receptor subunit TctC